KSEQPSWLPPIPAVLPAVTVAVAPRLVTAVCVVATVATARHIDAATAAGGRHRNRSTGNRGADRIVTVARTRVCRGAVGGSAGSARSGAAGVTRHRTPGALTAAGALSRVTGSARVSRA